MSKSLPTGRQANANGMTNDLMSKLPNIDSFWI
jgi:hypothetical protein